MIRDEKVYKLLSKPRKIRREITRVNGEIEALIQSYALPKAITYDKDPVQTSPEDPMCKYMAEKERLEKKRDKLLIKYVEAQRDISIKLDAVPELGALIITRRFLENLSFADIIAEVGLSERQMYRYYNEALEELAKNI